MIARPCARQAARKRSEIAPMEIQTRSAEIPARLRSQVKTTPADQMDVKKDIKDAANARLKGQPMSQNGPGKGDRVRLTYSNE